MGAYGSPDNSRKSYLPINSLKNDQVDRTAVIGEAESETSQNEGDNTPMKDSFFKAAIEMKKSEKPLDPNNPTKED